MKQLIGLVYLMALSFTANAALITSTSGDMDCFGLGGTCSDGQHYVNDLGGAYFADNSTAGDPVGTDIWAADFDPSFSHLISLAGGTVASAQMETFIAGPDLDTGVEFFLNGTSLGSYLETVTNTANTVILSIPVAVIIDGVNTLSVVASNSADGYIIDYTTISVTTRGGSVPVPAPIALIGLGLLGLGFSQRRNHT